MSLEADDRWTKLLNESASRSQSYDFKLPIKLWKRLRYTPSLRFFVAPFTNFYGSFNQFLWLVLFFGCTVCTLRIFVFTFTNFCSGVYRFCGKKKKYARLKLKKDGLKLWIFVVLFMNFRGVVCEFFWSNTPIFW